MRFTTRVPSDSYPTTPQPGEYVLLCTEGNPRPKPVKVVSAQAVGAELVLELDMPYTHVVAPGAAAPQSRRLPGFVAAGRISKPVG